MYHFDQKIYKLKPMKNITDIKFNYIPFNPTVKCWSENTHEYFYPKQTKFQTRISATELYPAQRLNISEITKILETSTNTDKFKYPCVQMWDIDTFAIDGFVEESGWNGCVEIDLDLGKSNILKQTKIKNPNVYDLVHEQIKQMCLNILPDNFLYFEKSSSGTGLHMLFFYDVEKTKQNHTILAEFTKEVLFDNIERYLKNGLKLFNEPGIFDDIYKRFYHKLFLTGKSAYINTQVNGLFSEEYLAEQNRIQTEKINFYASTFDNIKFNYDNIEYNNNTTRYKLPHQERLWHYMAVCELFKNKEEIDKVWYSICSNNLETYDNYTVTKFFNEAEKNHWYSKHNSNKKYKGNPKLLEKFGYTFTTTHEHKINFSNKGTGLEIKTYLGEEYLDLIRETIKQNNVCTIIGNTGIGKTEVIKKLLLETNGIVLTPFNSLRNMYNVSETFNELIETEMPTLFDDFIEKSRVLINMVGYNEEIKEDGSKDVRWLEFNKEKPNVMVYDQLVNIKDEELFGKTIFIDESHILFEQRDFRERLIKLLEKLIRIKEHIKIVLVSATPLDETKILGSTSELRFWKSRPIIKTSIEKVKYPRSKMFEYLHKNKNSRYYNRILIFTDAHARFLYDDVRLKYGKEADNLVSILHTDFWKKGDENNRMEQIIKSEMIDTKIVIGTSLVYNGINFKNEGEHNLVIVDFYEGSDNYWKVIQAAGRLRNSTCDLVILVKDGDVKSKLERLYDDRENAVLLADKQIPKGTITIKHKLSDDRIFNALEEIYMFNLQNSNLDFLESQLNDWGYFDWKETETPDTTTPYFEKKNELKKLIRESIKKAFIELNTIEAKQLLDERKDADFVGNEYFQNEIYKLNKFTNEYNVSLSYLHKYIAKFGLKACSDLKQIFRYIATDDNDWSRICDEVKKTWKDNTLIAKQQNKEIKKINKIRNQYKKFVCNCPLLKLIRNEEDILKTCKFNVMEEYFKNESERLEKINIKRTDAGSKGGSKKGKNEKKVKDIKTGIVYNSINEAVEQTGKGRATISRWLKSGNFIYI